MRRWLPPALLVAACLTAGAGVPPRPLESTRLFGRDYVRLHAWAETTNLKLSWIRPRKELKIASRGSELTFTVDSQRAVINGVNVILTAPIAEYGGQAYITELDLESSVLPVLYPPRKRPATPIVHVCLDPGHGGLDPGNHLGNHYEKAYTLRLVKLIKSKLTRAGIKVTQTRNSDVFVGIPHRSDAAARRDADLFVSIHFNATATAKDQVKGIETYCLTPEGATSTNAGGKGNTTASPGNRNDPHNMLLAYQIQRALVTSIATTDRGVKRARFQVLRETSMPAVLIEAGFLTHPAESRQIASAAHTEKLAQAITDGILAYKRLVERQ